MKPEKMRMVLVCGNGGKFPCILVSRWFGVFTNNIILEGEVWHYTFQLDVIR
jgi:hypothetical protein